MTIDTFAGPLRGLSSESLPVAKYGLASPLHELGKLDFSPLAFSVDELTEEQAERLSSSLQKANPAHLTGLRRYLYHSGWLVFLTYLGLVAFTVACIFFLPGPAKLLALLSFTALIYVIVTHVNVHSTVARPLELRVRAFELANNVFVRVSEDESDARQLQALGHFPRGDRKRWLRNRIVIEATEAMRTDLELGVYCYEVKSENDGKTSYSTRSIDYAFLPLPPDVAVPHWFDVDDKPLIGGRSHVALSAAFDRKFAVRLAEKTDDARLFITRAMAPDVQAKFLELASSSAVEFQFTPVGVIMRSRDLPLDELGKSRLGPDEHVGRALLPLVSIVHEVFEQLNPAYKQL